MEVLQELDVVAVNYPSFTAVEKIGVVDGSVDADLSQRCRFLLSKTRSQSLPKVNVAC